VEPWELALQPETADSALGAPALPAASPAPDPVGPRQPPEPWELALRGAEIEAAQETAPPIPDIVQPDTGVAEKVKRVLFNTPEFPRAKEIPRIIINAEGKSVPIIDKLSVAAYNPYSMADIYEAAFPGTKVHFDAYLNPYVEWGKGGKEKRYLNKPGPSMGDVSQTLISGAGYAAGGVLGGRAGKAVLGGAGRILGVGVGTAGASLGEDLMAWRQGAEQGLDLGKAATVGVLGAGGEMATSLLSRFAGALSRSRYVRNGKLTRAGRTRVHQMGADPDMVDDLMGARATAAAAGSDDPAAAVRVLQAQSLDPPVPLTKAEALGKGPTARGQWQLEEAMRKGVHGEKARNVMLGHRGDQAQALSQNVENLRQRSIGEGTMAVRPGEAAGQVSDDVRAAFAQQKAKTRAAYAAVREGDLAFDSKVITDAADDIYRYLRIEEGVDLVNDKAVAKWLGQLRETTTTESWRKQITREIQNQRLKEPATARLLQIMRDRVDEALDDAVDKGLAIGDPGIIDALKGARAERYKQSQLFGSTRGTLAKDPGLNIIRKLTEQEWTPEQSLNYLMGLGKIGAKQQAVQGVRSIKKIFGSDSPQVAMLRDELYLKLLVNQPQTGFSPARLRTAINDAFTKGYSLMDELVPRKDQGYLQRLAQTADDLVTPADALNPSGTAWAVLRALRQSGGGSGRLADLIIGRFSGPFVETLRAQQARTATQWFPKTTPLIPVGSGAVAPAAIRMRDPSLPAAPGQGQALP